MIKREGSKISEWWLEKKLLCLFNSSKDPIEFSMTIIEWFSKDTPYDKLSRSRVGTKGGDNI